jgi:dolichyl-diphosphooligosaccharide--protein glycosyltransferase
VRIPLQANRAGRRAPRLRALLPWLALFASAVVVRSLLYGVVFVEREVLFPTGADELYHLRRIWFTVVNFPASLDFDFYVNHPEGAPPVWPPFFDWGIAALARLLVGRDDQHGVEVVVAWVPPLLGALAVIAAAWLARRTFSPAAGWVTGALLVVLPAHVLHSALGQVDHHVAVGLFATLLLAAAMRSAGPLGPAGRPRGVVATGGMIAAAILLWPGALLHVLVVQVFFVAQLFTTRDRPAAVARARGLAVMHGVASVVLLPLCAGGDWQQFGAYSPEVLSNFQPLWFGAGAATFAGVAELWSRTALGEGRARRIGAALGPGALGLAAAWLLVPGLSQAVGDAAGWFGADPFLRVVAELRPLLYRTGRFESSVAHGLFSYLFWTYPLALVGLGWQALSRRRADVLLLLAGSAAFCAAALNQVRFVDVFAAGFACVVGPALVAGLCAARQRFALPRPILSGVALLAGLTAVLPQAPVYREDALVSAAALRGDPLVFSSDLRLRLVLQRVGRWIAWGTPPTQGYLDPTRRPEYGVLCAWGHGHLLRYYGERPMVQDNFGPWAGREGFAAARAYYESRDESVAAAIAERLRARYVVATLRGSGQAVPLKGSITQRLTLVRREGAPAFWGRPSDALTRHRLVFVADDSVLPRHPGEPSWIAAVYEIVPGARVLGLASGETVVSFDLAVPVPHGEPVRYRAEAAVDASGAYEIRLPYPSESGYAVHAGSQRGSLILGEADVREGRTVVGPSFQR